jgi:ABC-2 type transport system ATP-binding protein
LRHASPNTFSSGQKKKILLAQALIHDPKILIMDEPAANLDPKARGDFFRMLESLKKKNKAIFISSHILTEIDKYADSVTILDGGKVIFSGRKDELYKLFNLNTFRCDTTDNAFFKKLLKKEKINARKIKGALEFKIENYDKFHKMQTFLASKKIYFNLLEKKMPTLQDIYDKLVKKGSVDTAKKK